MKVLFVCLGNICRSPTAEAVFRAKAPHLDCDSAGTAGWHVGKPPYGPMQDAAMGQGYPMADLRARQFVTRDFDAFDLIIGMDRENIADIETLRPEGNKTQVAVFTDFQNGSADHVPDPYYTRDFDGALALIEDCADGLIKKLDRA